ncbi:TPA: UDP-glucose 4-epimerase, partial [Candidatus Uhrbacteria bacterium]|nr:UDP-glucose 4-epimerase [Candidatus Uhrbacteria bacterium]
MATEKERIIVTGGCGFIGSHLVTRLLREGYEVLVIDNMSTGKPENIQGSCAVNKLDVFTDGKKLKKVFQKFQPDVVFHLAAQKVVQSSMENPILDAQENILGSIHVLDAMRAIGGGRVVFASTAAVYDPSARVPIQETACVRPISPYGVSKRSAEMYMWNYSEHYPIAAISLRFSNAYGPRGTNAVNMFIELMLKGESPTIFGTGEKTRDFIFVDDIVEAYLRAMKTSWCGELNIATDTETSIHALYKLVAAETTYNQGPLFGEDREGEIFRSRLDATLAKEVLGWQAKVSVQEGI